MKCEKSVSFSNIVQCETYSTEFIPYSLNVEARERLTMERYLFKKPRDKMAEIQRIIESWRTHEISILFGNLGRQPYLLSYYLDLCFSSEENIQIQCQWKYQSHYEWDPKTSADFLFIIEPEFGATILKPPQVKHLIILTSHLCLYMSQLNAWTIFYHVTSETNFRCPDPEPNLLLYTSWKPPLFHEEPHTILPSKILLNVTQVKNAHEAYLRLLTGREIIQNRPFTIAMVEEDQKNLKFYLKLSEKQFYKIFEPSTTDKVKEIYWEGFF